MFSAIFIYFPHEKMLGAKELGLLHQVRCLELGCRRELISISPGKRTKLNQLVFESNHSLVIWYIAQ